jgi:SNF2 family DNA or RNA helicase
MNIEMIEQPEGLDIKLYVHQLASVYKMEKLERLKAVKINGSTTTINTSLGVNADITGYGKTISMVALVQRDRMEWDLEIPHEIKYIETYDNHLYTKHWIERYNKINTTLVLASRSVIHQWVNEFAHSSLNFVSVNSKKAATAINITEYDVIIVSPSFFNIVAEKGRNLIWKRFIFDEPSSVRVKSMATIEAGFTWLVTATPGDIYRNNRMLSRSYLHHIIGRSNFQYAILPYITIRNSEEFTRASFEMPQTTTINYECQDRVYRTIHGLVSDRITKMIEAKNIAGAIEALGGTSTDNIVNLVKKNKNIELEEVRSKIKIWTLRGDEEKRTEWENREKSLVTQLAQLEKRFEDIFQGVCTICYDTLNDPVMEPSCQNVFCGSCLLSWLSNRNSCPLCRVSVDKSKLIYIDKGEKKTLIEEKEEKIQTKENIILNVIRKGGKVILFSDWSESFGAIRSLLTKSNIEFIELHGTAYSREKQLELFRRNVNVIFVNSIIDSSGINMQNATDIILYHQMSEGTRTQILGRANRIGRTAPLTVHQLISV